jgi:hypothetical protein
MAPGIGSGGPPVKLNPRSSAKTLASAVLPVLKCSSVFAASCVIVGLLFFAASSM